MTNNDSFKQENKEKHQRKLVRSSKRLLFLRALFIALIIFSGYKILFSSKWIYPQDIFSATKSQNLVIVGTYITSKEKVLEVMKKVKMPKKPLYLIDVKAFEDRISEIKTVKSVHIRRYWFPARLQIVIEDKMPILMIASHEHAKPAAFFVEGGTLLSADLLPKNKKLYPLLVLTTGSNPNDNFINWKENRINQILELADKAREYSHEDVEYIDVRDPHNVFIKIKSVLIDLGELDGKAYTRLQSIIYILKNMDKFENKKIKYVDLRWDVAKFIKIEGKEPSKTETTEIKEGKEKKNENTNNTTQHEIG